LSKKSSRACSVKSKVKVLEQLSQHLEEMNQNVQRVSLEVTETKASIDTEPVVVEPEVLE
jgi:EAL domain-containing protein (putative c-di-GMP-specific phosphodiesterase class I)